MREGITKLALSRPKTVISLVVLLTVLFGLQSPRITIDTDPENMLEADQPDRVLHTMKPESLLTAERNGSNHIARHELHYSPHLASGPMTSPRRWARVCSGTSWYTPRS